MSPAKSRIKLGFIALALISAAPLAARESFLMPAWLQPYPGANEEITTSRGTVVATYDTSASVDALIAFHRGLFAAQNIPFEPEMYGTSALIRATPEGYSITIQISRKKYVTSVQITAGERPVIPKLTEGDVRRSMAKYDQPVYPGPGVPMPPLDWPSWLAAYGVQASPIREGVDEFRNQYMEADFDSAEPRSSIQAFYSDLLTANRYKVMLESSPITPSGQPAVVEGTHSFERSGRFVIRVNLTPTARGVHVTMRITAHRS